MQAQYEWKVDQLQQHTAEQQQACAQLKTELQAVRQVVSPCNAYCPARTKQAQREKLHLLTLAMHMPCMHKGVNPACRIPSSGSKNYLQGSCAVPSFDGHHKPAASEACHCQYSALCMTSGGGQVCSQLPMLLLLSYVSCHH